MSPVAQVITPADVLDSTQAPALRRQVEHAIASGAEIILIDLQATSFIDSSGLGALVVALKAVRAAGRRMCLCSLNQQAEILFNLTSMNQVFEVYTNQAEFHARVLGNT